MARAVREGRRREFAAFGWKPEDIPDPGIRETFQRSKLCWDEAGKGHHEEMLAWCRRLIALRRASTSLNDGDLHHVRVSFDESDRWLVMERGQVKVLINLGSAPMTFANLDSSTLVLASGNDVHRESDSVFLPPNRLAVLSHQRIEAGNNASPR